MTTTTKKLPIMKEISKQFKAEEKKKELYQNKQWYTVRSILGNQWANWFVLIGARERGKSFSVQEYCLNQFFNPKSKLYHVPFYWMRLNDAAVLNMKMNNGAKMFEPLLVYSFHLEGIKVKGDTVFLSDGTKLCYVWGLSTAYNNKGAAIFNKKNFKGANIIIDEIALEKGQRRTFDLTYNLKMQVENIVRSERENVRIFMILNNTEECPAVLAMFNFIPTQWGVYKLKSKHCVIDFIPNTTAYEERRKKALSNELDQGTGNFTNKIERDMELLHKGVLTNPQYIIKFSKDRNEWFTVFRGNVVAPFTGIGAKKTVKAMRRYIDETYSSDHVASVIEMNDARSFRFSDMMTQTRFYQLLAEIKK